MKQRRRVLSIAALGLAAALAACSADGLPPTGLASNDGPAAGDPYPSVGSTEKEDFPSPLSGPLDRAPGGREVIEKPTLSDIFAPSPLPEMSWGRQDAPVTIVQYASLTCPHCRAFHKTTYPEFKKAYIDTGKVRYVLREFPIGKTSGLATIALRCAPSEKYLELYGRFMDQQASWVSQEVRPDAVFAIAHQVGMTRSQFDACRENQGMIENLKWVKERGRKLGIIGTPNFFVGDRLIKRELTMADIRELVEPISKSGVPAAAAAAQ